MKTMPKLTLRMMRFAVEFMLTRIARWEDQHADAKDYQMRSLNGSLWQASQSLKELIDGKFRPMTAQARLVGMPLNEVRAERYAAELLSNAPIPLRPVD